MPSDGIAAFGPGRVNLIGEHTDYNDGLALPFAIDRGVTVTAERIEGASIEARADDLGEARAFVRGMAAELTAAGHELVPCRLTITGDLDQGSGLSSSAALEAALSLALLAVAGEPIPEPGDRRELARL